VVIFKGMPLAVTLGYFAAIRLTFEEARQIGKIQRSAKCVVLNQLDGGAAKLVAKLDIVPARFP
jgi:hypothetical protein